MGKIPYNLKVEQDLRDELSAYMEGKGSTSQSGDKIFDIQIPEFSLEAILTGSNKVTSQVIVDLFNIAMKARRKEILCWYCYYKGIRRMRIELGMLSLRMVLMTNQQEHWCTAKSNPFFLTLLM